jgi:anaerobic magnesium-protoporphyrin IX monomethyl ester cyclase
MIMPIQKQLDVLFVSADSSIQAYQELAKSYSAIEPPTWSLLLAQSCRSKGYDTAILDSTAERLSMAQSVERIHEANPRLVCFVVYGQNPNSGTTNMIGNTALADMLREQYPEHLICFVGSHSSALPLEVLRDHESIDLVLYNEGVYALHNLLASSLSPEDLKKVKGIGHKLEGQPTLNPPEQVVPQDRMDEDLPGYAWDLLPYDKKPLDLYRSHFWHTEYDHAKRTPFAAVYSSLGCRFKCDFCMINIVNRNDDSDEVVSAHSPNMRYWSPEFMLQEFDKLAGMGVETIRISDEMFFLDRRFFEPLLTGLVERDYPIRTWSYARVDTVRAKYLDLFQKAGMRWLGIGIEAADQVIRKEVSKGTFKEINIREVVQSIQDSGINVGANFIFGFPDDTRESMEETLALALELNTEFANMYPCQALPGSPLHLRARQEGWKLPDNYAGYAFLSYESQPLPTKHLSAAEVLQFRDDAWQTYFTNPAYLSLLESKFGTEQRCNVEEMAKIKLKRKLLEASVSSPRQRFGLQHDIKSRKGITA